MFLFTGIPDLHPPEGVWHRLKHHQRTKAKLLIKTELILAANCRHLDVLLAACCGNRGTGRAYQAWGCRKPSRRLFVLLAGLCPMSFLHGCLVGRTGGYSWPGGVVLPSAGCLLRATVWCCCCMEFGAFCSAGDGGSSGTQGPGEKQARWDLAGGFLVWGGDQVMDSVLWERILTNSWLRGGNGAKCVQKRAGFNVLGTSFKGKMVGTALGWPVATIPLGEQERVALWHDAAAFLSPPSGQRCGEEAFSEPFPPGEAKCWCSETQQG